MGNAKAMGCVYGGEGHGAAEKTDLETTTTIMVF